MGNKRKNRNRESTNSRKKKMQKGGEGSRQLINE
jgi:hypothetical protein